ncbi:MAG TPA: hypothetical protein VIH90_05505 [Candidatus Saccharimonadales bacterium]
MSSEIHFPAPQPLYRLNARHFRHIGGLASDMGGSLEFAHTDICRRGFVQRLGNRDGRRAYRILEPVISASSTFLKKAEQVEVARKEVKPGFCLRFPGWHTDGSSKTIIIRDTLLTKFVIGSIDIEHPVAKAMATCNDDFRPETRDAFSSAVDLAILEGDLQLFDEIEPFTAFGFTNRHVHEAQTNSTRQAVNTCMVKMSSRTA